MLSHASSNDSITSCAAHAACLAQHFWIGVTTNSSEQSFRLYRSLTEFAHHGNTVLSVHALFLDLPHLVACKLVNTVRHFLVCIRASHDTTARVSIVACRPQETGNIM